NVAGLERQRVLITRVERGLHLRPRKRCGDGRPVAQPQRVHADGRLVSVVLAPVDEDLPRPLAARHVDEDVIGITRLEELSERERQPLGFLVGPARPEYGYRQMESLAARRLRDALQLEPVQRLA